MTKTKPRKQRTTPRRLSRAMVLVPLAPQMTTSGLISPSWFDTRSPEMSSWALVLIHRPPINPISSPSPAFHRPPTKHAPLSFSLFHRPPICFTQPPSPLFHRPPTKLASKQHQINLTLFSPTSPLVPPSPIFAAHFLLP